MKKHGIFAALAPWSGSGQGAGQRLYYCRFAEDGAIVHDYVPAKRLSDGVLGMYDRTTGEFKTNAGSGAFTAGPETCGGQSPSKSFYKKEQRHDDTKSTLR